MAPDVDGVDYLLRFFQDVSDGYLVDVGAHDGVLKGSMSRDLMVKGWQGLLIEPLPEAFALLEAAYRDNPEVHCLQIACSDTGGTAELFPCKGVSTLNRDWAQACSDYWKHVRYDPPIRVQVRTLTNLLDMVEAPRHIHFLQIDTEGHDLHVLRGMDWTRTVDLVCVETLDMLHLDRREKGKWQPNPEMDEFLRGQGFKLDLLTVGGNGFYRRDER